MKKGYVLGFAFTKDKKQIVLIEKLRPEWQKGKYNGIGGKIEGDEAPISAMQREMFEETGVQTSTIDWKCFAKMTFCTDVMGGIAEVWVFTMFDDISLQASTYTDEIVQIFKTDDMMWLPLMHNVPLLIQLATQKEFDYVELTQFAKMEFNK